MTTEAYRKRKRDWAKTDSQKEYRKLYMRKWTSKNRKRASEIASKAYHKNKDEINRKRRISYLSKVYNLTLEDYNNLLLKQNNSCYICGKLHIDTQKGLHIDHDHLTGKIRGLLCSNCNGSLGWYELHKNIIEDYLKDIVY